MISKATSRFRDRYAELPTEIKALARKAYMLFRENPAHPGLNFKKVHHSEPIYSVRITQAYRALGLLEEGEIIWFWIGNHADYDRLLDEL